MPRIKDYPKYEDHVDKTMTWDKGNKELLPPGRTKLLQDGRFIFDMDDGTYTVSMQYFIENVLGLVNKDKKTIISDITFDNEKASFDIYKESIDIDGNSTGHKTKVSCSLALPLLGLLWNAHALMGLNWETITNDGFLKVRLPYGKFSGMASHDVEIPLNAITNISVTDGKLTYKVGDDTKTLDLTSVINNTVNNSGELQQKVSDLVNFRMSPMTPLINSAITSIEVSDAGNMHWTSYDGNTTDGSYDFGALIAKKVAEAKPADLPTDLTRNLNITDSGTATWTVNGEQKSVNITNAVTRQVNGKFAMRVDQLSQRVSKAVTNFDINSSGVTTWTSNGDNHTYDFSTFVDRKLAAFKPADLPTDLTRNLNITDSGTATWTVNGEQKSVNITNAVTRQVNGIDARVTLLLQLVQQAVTDFSIDADTGYTKWTSNNIKHELSLESIINNKIDDKLKSTPETSIDKYIKSFNASFSNDGTFTWVTSDDETHTFSLHDNFGSRVGPLESKIEALENSKLTKGLTISSDGTMSWTNSDGQSHAVDLKQFVSGSSVSSIPESSIASIL